MSCIKEGQEFYMMHTINLLDKTDYIVHKFICTKVVERESGVPWIEHNGGGSDARLCYANLDEVRNKIDKIHNRKITAIKGKIAELEQQLENVSKYELEIRE